MLVCNDGRAQKNINLVSNPNFVSSINSHNESQKAPFLPETWRTWKGQNFTTFSLCYLISRKRTIDVVCHSL